MADQRDYFVPVRVPVEDHRHDPGRRQPAAQHRSERAHRRVAIARRRHRKMVRHWSIHPARIVHVGQCWPDAARRARTIPVQSGSLPHQEHEDHRTRSTATSLRVLQRVQQAALRLAQYSFGKRSVRACPVDAPAASRRDRSQRRFNSENVRRGRPSGGPQQCDRERRVWFPRPTCRRSSPRSGLRASSTLPDPR